MGEQDPTAPPPYVPHLTPNGKININMPSMQKTDTLQMAQLLVFENQVRWLGKGRGRGCEHGGQGGGRGRFDACFMWGKRGHWPKDCPPTARLSILAEPAFFCVQANDRPMNTPSRLCDCGRDVRAARTSNIPAPTPEESPVVQKQRPQRLGLEVERKQR